MNTFARLSVVFALLVVIGSSAGRRRFCPRESRDGKECRAKKTPAQFKCGILYEMGQPCDADEANDNCYLLMQQLQDNKLDSCERMIGNLDGKQTIGNQLCDQAIRFLRKDKQDTSNGI